MSSVATDTDMDEKWRDPVVMEPIGVIHSPYREHGDAPRSGAEAPETVGEMIIDRKYMEAMADMKAGMSYIVIFCFNRSSGYSQTVRLGGDGQMTGLFSTHAPARPNPVGISVINVVEINENIIRFTGVDMFDGTPVLDIKSYMGR